MAEHKYFFNVTMSCDGCSNAIKRVLGRLEGVKSFDIQREAQTADVVTEESVPFEKVLQTIKNTGKKVNSAKADGVDMAV
ncbi:hypothetical protein L228DRAFT_268998 [Xylona heveae TC161]|uniref:HMA domain-containing protein n=1 Tax=Xylona heveae (strain CBS 132557 / TC161) TaxID=1328760 RepID=A0A165FY89_XYLHT|nr:hypothetical protein L228DRAFT_268998 [Xylona heveae TC161]KZF21526.1 hypothetical protein L228DRAFT_268998 [Xylona heveae TC161]